MDVLAWSGFLARQAALCVVLSTEEAVQRSGVREGRYFSRLVDPLAIHTQRPDHYNAAMSNSNSTQAKGALETLEIRARKIFASPAKR